MASTRKRSAALLLALLIALGVVATAGPAAVAAQADPASVTASNSLDGAVVLFRGRAKIGTAGNNPCNALFDPSGLNFPFIANDNDPGTEKCYKLLAPEGKWPGNQAAFPFCFAVGVVNGGLEDPGVGVPPPSNCSIEAQGSLKGFIFDQPHCGISESNGGNGTAAVFTASGPKMVALSNLGWIASAGTVVPVTGSWDSADPAKAKGARKLVALVQASGNTKGEGGVPLMFACFNPKGADVFDVNAVAVLSPVFSGDLPDPLGDKCDPLNVLKHPKKDACF